MDELYSDGTTEDGKTIFHVYGNVTLEFGEDEEVSFPIPEDHILDGMGYTLTIKPETGSIKIGNMRDVYISNGVDTVYIDSDGRICRPDETGKFVRTDEKWVPNETKIPFKDPNKK